MQNRPTNKLLFAGIVIASIVVFTLLQGYWALWDYHDGLSSSCIECSFFGDLFCASLLPLSVIGILQLIYYRLKPRLIYQTVFCMLALMFCWYIIDTIIFDEREASWSTYSNIWSIGIIICWLQVAVFGLVFGLIYYIFHPQIQHKAR
ncbi:hypothetical protein [Pedobacter nototheniae]|uniref:hypothetical protein n=1 Tax=Pedobacter nototheniae TaxID=2488994 RepID=UPI00292D8AA7|nr:hypothetical protein [Pedobacter nototheniae]